MYLSQMPKVISILHKIKVTESLDFRSLYRRYTFVHKITCYWKISGWEKVFCFFGMFQNFHEYSNC